MKIPLLLCILLLLLISCVKEVDLTVNELPRKVVVNGLIGPDSIFQIRVSLSSAMNEGKQLVDNAIVEVYEDGVYLYSLPNTENGWYKVWATPSEGKYYRVEVSVPGFETVYAETDIPIFPQIIEASYEKVGTGPDVNGNYESKTTIVFQDDPSNKNFYQPGINRYLYEQTRETDESILTESDLDYNPFYYYFSDGLFNGQEKRLQLMGGGIIISFMGEISYQQDYTHVFSIISEEYFKGIKTWTIHKYNQSSESYVNDPLTLLFLGDPIDMYSNVVGGLGVFAGYNSRILSVVPHE